MGWLANESQSSPDFLLSGIGKNHKDTEEKFCFLLGYTVIVCVLQEMLSGSPLAVQRDCDTHPPPLLIAGLLAIFDILCAPMKTKACVAL